jgi:ElaB/YqjD/DUF883 family membrane-anchored ribosome-binding protein
MDEQSEQQPESVPSSVQVAAEAVRLAEEALNRARQALSEAQRATAQQAEGAGQGGARDFVEQVLQFVSKYPGVGVGCAAALGFLLGRTLRK